MSRTIAPWMMATPVAILLLLGSVVPALALDMEFHTYGGFGPVTEAFRKIALIFSDTSYQGLFFTITALAIFVAGSTWTFKFATGMRLAPLAWGVPVIFGVAVYFGLFVPKGSITVYDPVLNRFETIGSIPVGVVATAGALNTIEKGLVEIIDTSGVPGAKYQENAGGIGFNLLRAATRVTPKDAHVKASLVRYMDDCVTFELTRPGTDLSLDTLRNNTSDFIPELAKGVNPMIYTVFYSPANPHGTAMTCTEAWDNIRPIISNPAFYQNAIDGMCGQGNFNPANAAERAACRQLAVNTLSATTGMTVNPENLLKQTYLANILYHFYYTADHEMAMLVQANRQITTSGMGMGVTMNAWVPIMRAVMTAVAIGLIPFLALFLPSPLIGKAISVMAGFFVFLTTWGITDAIIHGAAMNHAIDVFEDIRQSNLGVYAAMAFPEASTKIQAMFGVIRSSGIMLASFLTMMLIRFGGHALAMMAGSMQGAVQGAGSSAGRQLTTEGRQAAMAEQQRSSGFLKAWASMDEDFLNGRAGQGSMESFSDSTAWGERNRVASAGAQRNALSRAMDQGILSPDGSPESQMGALHSQHTIGTGEGIAQVTLDGRGGFAMTTRTGRTSGWETVSKTDVAGAGWTSHNAAAGMFTRDTEGGIGVAKTAAGLKMDLTAGNETRAIEKGAHTLANNTAIENALRADMADSRTSTQARSFDEQLKNLEQEKLGSKVDQISDLKNLRSEETGQSLQGFLEGRVGTPGSSSGILSFFSLGVGGKAAVQWQGKNGEVATFQLSESQSRMFEEQRMAARTEAFRDTLQDSQQLSYARGLARRVGASEAYSHLTEAQNIQTVRAAGGVNAETAFIRDWADHNLAESGGSASDANMRIAMERFNTMATSPNEHDRLRNEMQGWFQGKWGNAGALNSGDPEVHERLDRIRDHVSEQHGEITGAVEPAIATAGARTAGINSDSFAAPSQTGSLSRPDAGTVNDARNAIRSHTEREKAGDGNIQTTIPGLVRNIGSTRIEPPDGVSTTSTSRMETRESPFASLPGPAQDSIDKVASKFKESDTATSPERTPSRGGRNRRRTTSQDD